MARFQFRLPVNKPLYRLGGAEVPGGPRRRTLNDPNTFEITNDAAGHMAATDPRYSKEPAIDIGNGHCGEPVVAMARGWASRLTDPSGALGVRIDHGAGAWTEYWHFSGWQIPTRIFVEAGAVLGYLGNTGLGNGACHCHVMLKINETAIDPEPYVFGAVLDIQEDELLTAVGWSHISNRKGHLTVGSNFRSSENLDEAGIVKVFPAGTAVVPFGNARGEAVGTNDRWLACAMWVDKTADGQALGKTVVGYFHSSVVSELEPIEESGFSQADLDAAVTQGRAQGIQASRDALAVLK